MTETSVNQIEQREQNDAKLRQIHAEISKNTDFLKGLFQKLDGTGAFDNDDTKKLKTIFLDFDNCLDLLKLVWQSDSEERETTSDYREDEDDAHVLNVGNSGRHLNIDDLPQNIEYINNNQVPEFDAHSSNKIFKLEISGDDDPTERLNECDNTQVEDTSLIKIELECNEFGKNLHKSETGNDENQLALICDICERSFSSFAAATEHEKSHKKQIVLVCYTCNLRFQSVIELRKHLKEHKSPVSDEPSFQCDICGKSFSLRSNLKRHAIIHSAEPYKRDICPSVFSQHGSLKGHSMIHSDKLGDRQSSDMA